jgi:hypothetical protein
VLALHAAIVPLSGTELGERTSKRLVSKLNERRSRPMEWPVMV